MSARAGPAAAVTKPGKCDRTVWIGKDTHVIKHNWRLDAARGQVLLVTKLVNSRNPNRMSNTMQAFVSNIEDALSSKAAEMAHSVLKNKRDRYLKARQGGVGGSSSGTRRNADVELADPVITALRGGGRTRSGVATNKPDEQETEVDWRTQTAETFLASMDSMGTDNALTFLEAKGSEFAKDVRQEIHDLKPKAAVGFSLQRAIKVAMKHNQTNEGRRTWQTLLTAAAFRRRADDEEEEEEEEPMSISSKRKAVAMGVREAAWCSAVKRMKKLRDELHPTEAIKNGVYWFWPRAKRSDAASEELVALMRQFWHTDDVSRSTGNSGDRDMWKPSKSPTAVGHPRRQITEAGGGDAVYAKFLKWADYRSFKARQADEPNLAARSFSRRGASA